MKLLIMLLFPLSIFGDMRIDRVENGLTSPILIQGETPQKYHLLKRMEEMKIPSVSIAVINEGKIEWLKAYGADVHTPFQAGSVSKPVSAFAILSLVEQGILNLDEEVNQKLKSWKIPENEYTQSVKVTLRHLLSHSSGINMIGFDGYRNDEPLPTLIQTLEGRVPANTLPHCVEFIPGSKMSYSGGGYNVAQLLVEDVTHQTFQEFMQNTLLEPLGMSNSTFAYLPSKKIYPESAAAGLWTTPEDLAKWLIEIQNVLINGRKIVQEMVTPQVGIHGLGPVISGEGETLELNHKGRTDDFTCEIVCFPYLKKGAVVMTNAGNTGAFVQEVLRSIACEYQWPSYAIKIKNTIEIPQATLEKYVGRYGWAEIPNDIYDLFIFRNGNELSLKIGHSENLSRLYPEAENQFFLTDLGYDVKFKEVDGEIFGLTIIVQPGFEREFRKFYCIPFAFEESFIH